jgi:hypothetical protein
MGDFEDRLRRDLAELGEQYTPDPDLARRIGARTRERARHRRVSAVSAFVVVVLAVLGTAAALGVSERSPHHARVDGAAAGTTNPAAGDADATTTRARTHHTRHSTTTTTGDTTSASTGASGNGTHAPATTKGGGSHQGSSPPSAGSDGSTPSTTAVPNGMPEIGTPTSTDTAPPITDATTTTSVTDTTTTATSIPPTITVSGPHCPPVGASVFTATVSESATVTWSDGETGLQATFTFTAPGTTNVSATATNAAGQSTTTSYPVDVGATC